MEEVIYNEHGKLITDALSTLCKVPDTYGVPKEIKVNFLNNAPNKFGPFNSKAMGEPPLMYGIGAFFAVAKAMREFNNKIDIKLVAPMTHERVLMILYSEIREKVKI